MKICILFVLCFCPPFFSCLYKAGNRKPDLNFDIYVNLNTYYVEKYLLEKVVDSIYRNPLNSELANFPKDFIPLTDSAMHLKYVIELRVSRDSLKNNGLGLILSSIYSFSRHRWLTDRDSLKNGELDKFQNYFRDSILEKVANYYADKLPDSVLFIDNSRVVKIDSLQ